MKSHKTVYERFTEMTEAQRNDAIAKYDREMPGTPGKPLSARGKAEHAKARRRARAGRPRIGHGAKRVLITVERGLLKRADAYAREHGLNRSELIARGLASIIGSAA
jgi:hypothetical protein